MLAGRSVRRLPDPLREGDEAELGRDARAYGGDLLGRFRLLGSLLSFADMRQALLQSGTDVPRQERLQVVEAAAVDDRLGRGNGGPEVRSGGLQTIERSALALAVKADDGFHEA